MNLRMSCFISAARRLDYSGINAMTGIEELRMVVNGIFPGKY